ncbi:MAG TPA: hypothetical protein VGG66_03775, partial [Rhizomicrobium sp.]
MTEKVSGTGIVRFLGRIGGAGHQFAPELFARDLNRDAVGHLGEGFISGLRHRQDRATRRDQTAHTDSWLEHALNGDVLAENIRDRIAIFLLGEATQPHHFTAACGPRRQTSRSRAGQNRDNSKYSFCSHTT